MKTVVAEIGLLQVRCSREMARAAGWEVVEERKREIVVAPDVAEAIDRGLAIVLHRPLRHQR